MNTNPQASLAEPDAVPPIASLTERQWQIANAIARGLTNKQIGAEFGISPETVKRHLASIYHRLALKGRVALAIHVIRSRSAA